MRKVMLIIGIVSATSGFSAATVAHEGRVFAPYVIFVGFRNEPASEDEANGLDYFVFYDTDGDGQCADETCSDWIPVDAKQFSEGVKDEVSAEVHALYLEDDAFDAKVLATAKLTGELGQDFEDPSRYNIFFKPNVDGAYGFQLDSTIQYKGSDPNFPDPGPVLHISGENGKFVCEGGSQVEGELFSCVADILQPFPGGARANYRDNPPLSGHHNKSNDRGRAAPGKLHEVMKRLRGSN